MYVYDEERMRKSEYTWEEGGALQSFCGMWQKQVRAVSGVVRRLLYKSINGKIIFFMMKSCGEAMKC